MTDNESAELDLGSPPVPLGSLAPRPGVPWSGPELAATQVLDADTLAALVRYLRAGTIFDAWMSYSEDLIGGAFSVPGGHGIKCDGEFYWRADAPDYLLRYPVEVPREALDAFAKRGWQPPQIIREDYRRYWVLLHNYLVSGVWGDETWGDVRAWAGDGVAWRPGPEPEPEGFEPPPDE